MFIMIPYILHIIAEYFSSIYLSYTKKTSLCFQNTQRDSLSIIKTIIFKSILNILHCSSHHSQTEHLRIGCWITWGIFVWLTNHMLEFKFQNPANSWQFILVHRFLYLQNTVAIFFATPFKRYKFTQKKTMSGLREEKQPNSGFMILLFGRLLTQAPCLPFYFYMSTWGISVRTIGQTNIKHYTLWNISSK